MRKLLRFAAFAASATAVGASTAGAEVPQHAQVTVAPADPAKQGAERIDRTVGICYPIENSPNPKGLHGSTLSPLVAAKNYFRIVEHRVVDASGKTSVLENPVHGELKRFLDGGSENFEYLPAPGYLGPDRATLLVEI